jgi:glucosamine-phosphate N-acetyltransferase
LVKSKKKPRHGSELDYIIRGIETKDITEGQFLKVLENLSVKVIARNQAQRILQTIESNPLHKIFVAVQKNIVIGAVTLLVEPKFIYDGGKVAHIEDVVVKKEFAGKGIGSSLVKFAIDVARVDFHCAKVILDCSDKNVGFYERLGFSCQDNGMTIIW